MKVQTTPAALLANLDACLERVVAERLELVVRRRGKAPAVIVPWGEWTKALEALNRVSNLDNEVGLRR
jgi:hypothetical protein